MKLNKIIKYPNSESPESFLKVKYISYLDNKNQKQINLNPSYFNKNIFPKKINYKINDLRKAHFNSFTNENMDFFRLDHLFECDRGNYHNKFMDNIKPINRKENFDKFNEIAKNIKYLDYLKENYLLNQNRVINKNIISDRDLEIAKKREKYYKNQNITIDQNNRNNILEKNNYQNRCENNRYAKDENNHSFNISSDMNMNINKYNNVNKDNPYKRDRMIKSNSALSMHSNFLDNNINNYNNNEKYKNNIINNDIYNFDTKNKNQNYSNLYLANINNYSIKEGDTDFNKDNSKLKLNPTFPKESLNKDINKCLYNQDSYKNLLNNNPFYIAYNENSKNVGFLKRNRDFSNCEKIYKNKFFLRNNSNDIYKIIGNKNNVVF